jgi:dehydrogenase/reductase SDR family member 12
MMILRSSIDCLVCNAGVLLNEKEVTSEGNEMTFATHLLGGTFLLSQLLLPQLQACPGEEGRVVVVTSGGMYNFKWPGWDLATSSPNSKVKYNRGWQSSTKQFLF